MEGNTENLQKYIIRKIVKSVEYDADTDTYAFHQCQISDEIIHDIIQEAARYSIPERDARQYISLTAGNIKTQPQVTSIASKINITDIPFGQHIRIDFKHPEKGFQWIECIKTGKNTILVLSSSINGLSYNTTIHPLTDEWSIGFYTDFSVIEKKNSILRVGEIKAIKLFSPSIIHEILDSSRTFSKDEEVTEEDPKKTQKKRNANRNTQKLIETFKEIDIAIRASSIQQDYDKLKNRLINLDCSSYTLNLIIAAIKQSQKETPSEDLDKNFFISSFGEQEQMMLKDIEALKQKLIQAKQKYNTTIKKKNGKEGWLITILILLIFAISGLSIQVHTLNKDKDTQGKNIKALSQENKQYIALADSLRKENIRAKEENTNLKKKVKIWEQYSSQIPFIVKDIQIANGKKFRDIKTDDYGKTIYSSQTFYLYPKLSYIGLISGKREIKIKFYKPNGVLSTGGDYLSPKDCSYIEDCNISEGEQNYNFSGWGGKDQGHWGSGKYRIEIWYQNTCLGYKEFTIY